MAVGLRHQRRDGGIDAYTGVEAGIERTIEVVFKHEARAIVGIIVEHQAGKV